MEQMIHLGPLNIKYSWLAITCGLVLGYILLTSSSPYKGDQYKPLRETVAYCISYFIITFFFGSILFQLPTFVTDPLAVISYPSGQKELILATIVVFFYVFLLQKRKRGQFMFKFIHAFMYVLLPATIVYAFFEQKQGKTLQMFSDIFPWNSHPVSLYTIFIMGILLLYLMNKETAVKEKIGLDVYFLWVLSLSFIQSFNTTPQFFPIVVTQIYYLFLFFIGIIVFLFSKKIVEKEG